MNLLAQFLSEELASSLSSNSTATDVASTTTGVADAGDDNTAACEVSAGDDSTAAGVVDAVVAAADSTNSTNDAAGNSLVARGARARTAFGRALCFVACGA